MELQKSNPVHKEVRSPKYKPRVERKRKGKGSFKREKRVVQD